MGWRIIDTKRILSFNSLATLCIPAVIIYKVDSSILDYKSHPTGLVKEDM